MVADKRGIGTPNIDVCDHGEMVGLEPYTNLLEPYSSALDANVPSGRLSTLRATSSTATVVAP